MSSLSAVQQQEGRNRLFAAIPRRTRERMSGALEIISLDTGRTLYEKGEPLHHVYFPEDCVLTRLYPTDRGIEVGLIGNEGMAEIAIVLGESHAPSSVIVEVGGTALRARASAVREAVEGDEATRRQLMSYYGALVDQLSQVAVCHCQHTLMQSLCRWLLMVSDRAATDHLPLTHETLAKRLGKRRPGITDCAGELQRAGAITYRRGHIHILDRRRLEQFSCSCYGVMRATFEQLFQNPSAPTDASVRLHARPRR